MGTDSEKGRYKTPEGSQTWEYLAIFACAISSFCVGNIVGWNSPSVVKLMAPDSPIPVTASDASTLVAVVAIGHMLAPPINSLIVDRIGRKNTNLISVLPLIISWGLIMVANNVWVLYTARFMAGLCLGLVICVCPMYVGEISSPATRGAGGALVIIMYNLGILLTFITAPHLSIPAMAGVLLAVTIGFVIFFWFMPASPYFLAMKNRLEEAEEVLEKLRGKNDVSEELETIVASLTSGEKNVRRSGSLKDIFTVRGNRRAFGVIFSFVVTHHFGGFLVLLTYGQLIFQSTKSPISDYMANVMVGVMQVTSAVLITFLVDRLGRKPLILASGSVAGLCNLVIGIYFYAKDYLNVDVSAYSLAPFIASMIMVFAFNCGLMSLQFIMMSEIFATEIKAIGTCVIGITGGLLGTLSCKLYILITITWGYGHCPPFLGFFVIDWICTAFILYYAPETKGKTFLQIQRELNK